MSYRSKQEKKWLAHVWLETGTCVEVREVGKDRWEASAKVYKTLGLEGPNDKKIRRFVMEEVLDPPLPPAGSSVVDLKPAKQFVRYRVRLFASPNAADPYSHQIQTQSAQDALWDVMKLHKIPTEAVLGPYCVQEETRTGWITRMVKHAHTFPDAGPLDMEITAQKPVAKKPLALQPVDEYFRPDEGGDPSFYDLPGDDGSYDIWDNYTQAQGQRGWTTHVARKTEESVIKKVEDIFANEQVVTRITRTVVKG